MHCLTCGKDSLAAACVARALALAGIGVLPFDFADLGASEGRFADSSFSGDVDYIAPDALAGVEADGEADIIMADRAFTVVAT